MVMNVVKIMMIMKMIMILVVIDTRVGLWHCYGWYNSVSQRLPAIQSWYIKCLLNMQGFCLCILSSLHGRRYCHPPLPGPSCNDPFQCALLSACFSYLLNLLVCFNLSQEAKFEFANLMTCPNQCQISEYMIRVYVDSASSRRTPAAMTRRCSWTWSNHRRTDWVNNGCKHPGLDWTGTTLQEIDILPLFLFRYCTSFTMMRVTAQFHKYIVL